MFVTFEKYSSGEAICLNIQHIKSVESINGVIHIYTTLQENGGEVVVRGNLEDVLYCLGAKNYA